MKKFFTLAMILAAPAALVAQDDYELRVLTFEDEDWKGAPNMYGESNWTSLIDDPQYGGEKLYGESGMGTTTDNPDEVYHWVDENNTWLSSGICAGPAFDGSGASLWCYWSGGHAISNYGSSDIATYGDYMNQLTIYNPNGTEEVSQTGNGHNKSNNFAVHFGYGDTSGYGLTAEYLPQLKFTDGEKHVIDHVYIALNCYAISCYIDGNSLTANIGDGDWVKIVASGYDDIDAVPGTDEPTKSLEFYLCDGPEHIVRDWTKFDLYELGEVAKLVFDIQGSSDNGYGFSQPAYFCFDDLAVRFPKEEDDIETGVKSIVADDQQTTDDAYYNLMGQRVENPTPGIYIHNGKKVIVR